MRKHGRQALHRTFLVEEEILWSQLKARDKDLRARFPEWFQAPRPARIVRFRTVEVGPHVPAVKGDVVAINGVPYNVDDVTLTVRGTKILRVTEVTR